MHDRDCGNMAGTLEVAAGQSFVARSQHWHLPSNFLLHALCVGKLRADRKPQLTPQCSQRDPPILFLTTEKTTRRKDQSKEIEREGGRARERQRKKERETETERDRERETKSEREKERRR